MTRYHNSLNMVKYKRRRKDGEEKLKKMRCLGNDQ